MKKIVITLILDPIDGYKISLDEKLENGQHAGETVVTDWEKFKNVSLNNIVAVHKMITNLRQVPCCTGATTEELLEMTMSNPNEIFITKIVQFLRSLTK